MNSMTTCGSATIICLLLINSPYGQAVILFWNYLHSWAELGEETTTEISLNYAVCGCHIFIVYAV